MIKNNLHTRPQNNHKVKEIRARLLDWYDRHRRVLPWRALPSERPVPYHVWLSEIMLQQTVVRAVIPYFEKFVEKWPTIKDLAAAEQHEVMEAWAGLGYYSRARNLYKCAQIITREYQGDFPQEEKALKALPGVGDYTAAAIMAIAFNKPATVVDGNIERVMARLYAVTEPLPDSKKMLKALAHPFFTDFTDRPGDLAQAMMDLGAGICIPKAPKCILCPVAALCQAREDGIAEQLPARTKKKQKPQKHGYVYFIENEHNEIVLQRRPENGMLGGMLGFPSSEWVLNKKNKEHASFIKNTAEVNEKERIIRHSFTHFDLELTCCFINKKTYILPEGEGFFWHKKTVLDPENFPTLFKKFFAFFR